MKKLVFRYGLLVIVISLLIGCVGCDDNSTGPKSTEQASAKREFIWNAMNYWYYWQDDKPELADNHHYFDNDQAFNDYLNSFTNADSLFQNLRYKRNDVDRFSFFIKDYNAYEARNNGIYAATGLEYTIITFRNTTKAVGYIRYVVPNSPADKAGVKRGNLFTRVDGTTLTPSNYRSLLMDNGSHSLTLATIEEQQDGSISFKETGKKIPVQSREVTEDPVFLDTVINTNNTQIGYLVYNAFHGNTHKELNEVFGDFKTEGIDELVLDLRYNGGGAVITSQTLSSMISGRGSSDEFAELTYNNKRSTNDQKLMFLDKVPIEDENGDFYDSTGSLINPIPMNKLSLNRVFVLTSFATASASEALINGLKPYMDVELIGTTTVGKDEGSLTLYDAPSPYTDEEKANPDHNHNIALQPIVLKITNKNQNHYSNGFTPNLQDSVDEIDYLLAHQATLPPLGNPKDPLLAKAISVITGQTLPKELTKQSQSSSLRNWRILMDSQDLYPHSNGMYLTPAQISH